MTTHKITRHASSRNAEPASRPLPPPHTDEIALIVSCAVGAIVLFGGIIVDHLPESSLLQGAFVGAGVAILVAAALWLDRRGSQREAARPPMETARGAGA